MAPPFCAAWSHRSLIVLLLGACLSLAPISKAAGKEIVLEACEADDARYALHRFGQPYWRSDWQQLGMWRFANDAHLACGHDRCVVSTAFHLTFDEASRPATTDHDRMLPSPFPHHERDGIEQTVIRNGDAADLRKTIRNQAYRTSANEIGVVWLNYGRLARFVRLRSRTEIKCRTNELHCLVENSIIAFVSYDEHNECGYLSKDADPEDFLY